MRGVVEAPERLDIPWFLTGSEALGQRHAAPDAQAEGVRERLARDPDQAAPHVVDAEVLGIIRLHRMIGLLDGTAALQAVEDLRDWPGERFGHRALLARAWELRHGVRTWDALYVASAEALDGALITLDQRLGGVDGLACRVEVLSRPG